MEYKLWDHPNNCPYCGLSNSQLDYDVITEDDGSLHDVVDCPGCKARLYYEE